MREVNCHEAQHWTPECPVVHKYDYDASEAARVKTEGECERLRNEYEHAFNSGEIARNECDQLRDELATLKAGAGGAVAWQFYQDGKWWLGDDRIKNHRSNTEGAGIPVRGLYTAPQPAPDVSGLVSALNGIASCTSDDTARDCAMKALSKFEKG